MLIRFGRCSVVVQIGLVFVIGQEGIEVGFDMMKAAELRALLRERPDGFALITNIIDAKQIDYLSRESISRESSNLQRLITRGKMSKDNQRIVLDDEIGCPKQKWGKTGPRTP